MLARKLENLFCRFLVSKVGFSLILKPYMFIHYRLTRAYFTGVKFGFKLQKVFFGKDRSEFYHNVRQHEENMKYKKIQNNKYMKLIYEHYANRDINALTDAIFYNMNHCPDRNSDCLRKLTCLECDKKCGSIITSSDLMEEKENGNCGNM